MLIESGGIMGISNDLNGSRYWEPTLYPSWSRLNVFRLMGAQPPSWGPEPHFHDIDEYWFFVSGYGEVGLGARRVEVTPNSVVYTSPGVVHRFVMYTPSTVVAAVARLSGRERTGHLWCFDPGRGQLPGGLPLEVPAGFVPVTDEIDQNGTGASFVVNGEHNNGQPWPSSAGPLEEFRCLTGDGLEVLREPWLVTGSQWLMLAAGSARLHHEHGDLTLSPGDAVVASDGTLLTVDVEPGAVVVRATERMTASRQLLPERRT